jgi:hypothetical protein
VGDLACDFLTRCLSTTPINIAIANLDFVWYILVRKRYHATYCSQRGDQSGVVPAHRWTTSDSVYKANVQAKAKLENKGRAMVCGIMWKEKTSGQLLTTFWCWCIYLRSVPWNIMLRLSSALTFRTNIIAQWWNVRIRKSFPIEARTDGLSLSRWVKNGVAGEGTLLVLVKL